MNVANKKNRTKNSDYRYEYLLYSLLFILISLVTFSYFYLQKKTFISAVDGYYQYYKALIYYHRYLNDIISTLVHDKYFVISQFNFHIGEGSDILSALYFTIGNPIAALVAFVPEKYISLL